MPKIPSSATSSAYLRLVRQFPLRRLKTAAEHQRAVEVYKRLVMKPARPKLNAGTLDYLDMLVDMIADYEHRAGWAINTEQVTAAQIVRHCLSERKQSVHALAKQIGIAPSNLAEMLSGRRDWSKAAIVALIDVFPIDPRKFLQRSKAA